MARTAREEAQKNIAENRKAFHDYHIVETFEAGIVLVGTEVKSIREGSANLRDSFARVEGGEVWVYNVHINPYSHRGYSDHEPTRPRKLLLHLAPHFHVLLHTGDERLKARQCQQSRHNGDSPHHFDVHMNTRVEQPGEVFN